MRFEQIVPEEPETVAQPYVEAIMPVDLPKFELGFKQPALPILRDCKERISMEILLEIIAGKLSPLYHELLEQGLVNSSFYVSYLTGRGFALPTFVGESSDPERVRAAILARIEDLRRNGISDEDFALTRKSLYGREIRDFSDMDDLAYQLVTSYFSNETLFSSLETYRAITKGDVEALLDRLQAENSSFSVVKGETK